ncbi:MAG: hypothetical protein Q4D35_05905, partial [Ruminococcus sp.]|nr:hypothetical protein [Ruminococcus sp.]
MLKKVLSGALALTMLFTAFVLPGAVSAEEDILQDGSSKVVDDSSVAEDESSEVVDDSSVVE